MDRIKLIIDTDPAIGIPARDVDDGLALLYLLAHPERFDILGITVVKGNASQQRAYEKAIEVIEVAGRKDVPVLSGAAGRRSFGEETGASVFLEDAVREYPGEVTLLTLGPLTNVATSAVNDPGFLDGLDKLVIMGGALEKGIGLFPFGPWEFNFLSDPLAAYEVVTSPSEKILITADLCRQAVFTRRELVSLRAVDNDVCRYLERPVTNWFYINLLLPALPWENGFVPWDVVAAAYIDDPGLFGEVEEMSLGVWTTKIDGGRLFRDPMSRLPLTKVPMRADGERITAAFLESIARYPLSQDL